MKSITRRTALSACLIPLAASAWAQSYPARPIRIVVPSPPGGSTDQLARLVGQKLAEAWQQPVVVENRPGAGLTLGADFVSKAPNDGYTLLLGAVHHSIAQAVYKRLPYNFERDLTPITVIAVVPNVMIVPAAFPAQTTAEFIALAKANPGKYTYGSTGAGTAHHLIGEQFNEMAGTDLRHIPYKGSAPALIDLIGGQIDVMFDTVASCLPHINSGKVRAIAVTTGTRSQALPKVPTLSESGLPGFNISSWFGLMAPVGTPADIVNKLHAEVVRILALPDTRKQLDFMGAEPVGNTPAQLKAQIRGEIEKFTALAKKAKLSME
jgi:tripartite-type tricarboxylate transporter receptor subunit TctC